MNNENMNNLNNDTQNNNQSYVLPVNNQAPNGKKPNIIVIGIISVAVVVGLIFGVKALLGTNEKNPPNNNGNNNGNINSLGGTIIESDSYVLEYKLNNDFRYVAREDYTLPIINDGGLFQVPAKNTTHLLLFTGEILIKSVKDGTIIAGNICGVQPIRITPAQESWQTDSGDNVEIIFQKNSNDYFCRLNFPENIGKKIQFLAILPRSGEFDYVMLDIWPSNSYDKKTPLRIDKKDLK